MLLLVLELLCDVLLLVVLLVADDEDEEQQSAVEKYPGRPPRQFADTIIVHSAGCDH